MGTVTTGSRVMLPRASPAPGRRLCSQPSPVSCLGRWGPPGISTVTSACLLFHILLKQLHQHFRSAPSGKLCVTHPPEAPSDPRSDRAHSARGWLSGNELSSLWGGPSGFDFHSHLAIGPGCPSSLIPGMLVTVQIPLSCRIVC